VAELADLVKVTTVEMIESEMDYRAANPFTIHISSYSARGKLFSSFDV
jgi:hypothetical protein